MTNDPERNVSDRISALEAQLTVKKKRGFPTATVLAVLPICFGLYQFHLSNEFKKEDNQTRALLAALEGESPSAICGNLSLLVEGGLVTGERLEATQSLIDEITQKDRQQLDGGVTQFDCLPRIAPQGSETSNTASDQSEVTQADRLAAPNLCFFEEVELHVIPEHDTQVIQSIAGFLEDDGVVFAEVPRDATEWEINNYSGKIWYYSIEARQCAKFLSDGLEALGISLSPRYYTRADLPSGLPIRIWPSP